MLSLVLRHLRLIFMTSCTEGQWHLSSRRSVWARSRDQRESWELRIGSIAATARSAQPETAGRRYRFMGTGGVMNSHAGVDVSHMDDDEAREWIEAFDA